MNEPSREFRGIVWVIPTFLLLLALFTAPAAAIGVTGAKYMGSIAPGGTDTHVMTIEIGTGEDPTDVSVEVKGFGQTLGAVYIPLDASSDVSPYSARSFIALDRSSVHLDPGSGQTVNAVITLPPNVGQGGRYAIISVRALPGKGKAFSTAVDVPVFITVSGTAPTEAGSILQVDTAEVTIGQPIVITTTLKNTGNYHYYDSMNWITVQDVNGAVLANFTTTPQTYAIIPGNTVRFIAKPSIGSLQAGTYTVVSRVLLADGRVLDEKSATFEVKEPYIPPVTESNITLTPGSPGTLTSPDGRYTVIFPQGSVLGDVVIILKPYEREKLRPAPSGAVLSATTFEITGLPGLLSKDATIRVIYSSDDLAAAGGDPSRLRLAYWNPAQNKWVILDTNVNTQDRSLTATANQMGVWAVMVSTSPGPVSPTGTKAPLPVFVDLMALVIATGSLIYVARRRT